MIESLTLGTTALTNSNRFCTAIKSLSFPSISASSAKKGGYAGSKIVQGQPEKLKFSTEWVIIGTTFSDAVTQREDFIELLGMILSEGSQTLKINKANSVNVQVDVQSVSVTGDIGSMDKNATKLLVTFEAEYPFLISQTLTSQDVNIFNGGGMTVPMAVPMDMTSGAANESTLTNGGNFDAYPIFTFYGPLENPSLLNSTTGEIINVAYTLDDGGEYIVVDTFNRTAVLYPGATNARRYVTGDFWTLAKGVNIIHLGNTSYNVYGKVKIEYRDTYLNL